MSLANYSILVVPKSTLATGDIVYRTSGEEWSRLAAGADGKVLKLASGIPSWGDDTGFANPMTTVGDIIIGAASGAPGRLARPSEVGYLSHDGTATNPTWRLHARKQKGGDTTSAVRGTTMTDDPDLIVALGQTKQYCFHLVALFDEKAASDFKYDFNYTGTAPTSYIEAAWNGNGSALGFTSRVTSIGTDTVMLQGVDISGMLFIHGFIVTGTGSAGNFSWRWAENTASTNNTVYKGSTLTVWEAL